MPELKLPTSQEESDAAKNPPVEQPAEIINSQGQEIPVNKDIESIFKAIESGQTGEEAVKAHRAAKEEKKPQAEEPETREESKAPEVAETKVEEKKAEEPKPDPKEDLKPDEKKVEEVAEEELRVLPTDKPKTAKRIDALLGKVNKLNDEVTTTKKEAAEKAAKLAEYEQELTKLRSADPATNEKIKAQLDELAMYRRQYEIEKDPEVKTKFDGRVDSAEKEIEGILSKNGAPKELIDIIKEEGGWGKFSGSERKIKLAGDKVMPAYEMAESILGMLKPNDKKMVEFNERNQILARHEREQFIQQEKAKAVEFFTNRDKEAQAAQANYNAQLEANGKMLKEWDESFPKKAEFLKIKEIPANATPEQKKEIEEDNAWAKQAHSIIKTKYLGAQGMKGMLETIEDASNYHGERRKVAKLEAKTAALEAALKAKQEEFDKFKTAGRTTKGGGSLNAATTVTPTASKSAKNIEDAFAMVGQGIDPNTGDPMN